MARLMRQGVQFLENLGKSWKKKIVMESPLKKKKIGKSPGKSLKSHGKIFVCLSLGS